MQSKATETSSNLACSDLQPPVLREYEFQLRVRYRETDAQGRVHHSNYLNYFEIARVEMLRASGRNYKDLETAGIFLVVTKAICDYHRGAVYDDLLTIKAKVTHAKKSASPMNMKSASETNSSRPAPPSLPQ